MCLESSSFLGTHLYETVITYEEYTIKYFDT